MRRLVAFAACVTMAAAHAQQRLGPAELAALADSGRPGLREAITAAFPAKGLKEGTAWSGHGPDFFFAVETEGAPSLVIDERAPVPMKAVAGSKLWYLGAHVEPLGKLHAFHYMVGDKELGGQLDMPAFGPLSYLAPGVRRGTLSAKLTHVSKIYDGMVSEYWVYAPAGYNAQVPAALMVFQDGGGYLNRESNNPALNVIDNLVAQGRIPMIVCVFINPGDISGSSGTPTFASVSRFAKEWDRTLKDSMRSTLYDTVSDRYERFLREEVLAEVGKHYLLRKDAYSRAITGASSGGIASFNAAWQAPEDFSRVLSWIGSFTSIQWKERDDVHEGGQDFPEKVLREPHRNVRVWLQDGANDQENPRYGSWPLANLRLANALKLKNYDFHLSFGKGTHNYGQGAAEFPESMIWLWRDYDPAKAEQMYVQEPAEKAKPPFRVAAMNR